MNRNTEDCEWCEGAKDCPQMQNSEGLRPGYACTRTSGHKGRHVVCFAWRHLVAEWADPVAKERQP